MSPTRALLPGWSAGTTALERRMAILKSDQPSIHIPNVSVTEHVLRHADRLKQKAAFIEGTSGRVVTYGEFAEQVHALAGGLAAKGFGPGTTWALMAPNVPEYAVVFHGLALAGVTVTTLNPTYGAEEIAFQLKDANASALVTVAAFLDTANDAAKKSGDLPVYLIGPGDALSVSTLMGAPLENPPSLELAEAVAVLPYSSGTTGFPKGVMLTHRNLVANIEQLAGHLPLEEDEICFAVLPFFHIYGMQVLMNFMLTRGGTIVTAPRFDMVQMLDLVQQHHITRLFLVPPIVLALA
jgi:4-coumarate--CoA ligase